jgi:hypothetical protein
VPSCKKKINFTALQVLVWNWKIHFIFFGGKFMGVSNTLKLTQHVRFKSKCAVVENKRINFTAHQFCSVKSQRHTLYFSVERSCGSANSFACEFVALTKWVSWDRKLIYLSGHVSPFWIYPGAYRHKAHWIKVMWHPRQNELRLSSKLV